jgi:hypothetical protein
MSLKHRLWDAVYAMAELCIKMNPSEKGVVILVVTMMLYVKTAEWVGLGPA